MSTGLTLLSFKSVSSFLYFSLATILLGGTGLRLRGALFAFELVITVSQPSKSFLKNSATFFCCG